MKSIKIIFLAILCLALTNCNTGTDTLDETSDEEVPESEVTIEDSDIPEEAAEQDTAVIDEPETSEEVGITTDIIKYLEEEKFNGSILVHADGETILSKGFGLANAEGQTPNTPDTVFIATTLTMQFTAVSVLMLEEQGILNVDDPVSMYVDDYAIDESMTIHDLLTHKSGFVEYHGQMVGAYDLDSKYYDFVQQYQPPQALFDLFIDLPLKFEPGSQFDYNSSNYILLGYVIEKASGMTYEAFVKENILEPLAMKNTGFNYIDNFDKYALPYDISESVKDGSLKYYPVPEYNASYQYAFAGLSSTVEDLYKWHKALNDYKLISKESTDRMYKPYTDNPYLSLELYRTSDDPEFDVIPVEGYGYGWFVDKSGEKPIVYHLGAASSYHGHIYRDLENDRFIVFLSNKNNGSHLWRRKGHDSAYDKAYEIRDGILEIISQYSN